MSRQPKFSDRTQALVNACQSVEVIPGATVVLTLDAASQYARESGGEVLPSTSVTTGTEPSP